MMHCGKYSRSIVREISKDLLPECVRWRTTGSDPVCEKWANEVASECFDNLKNEMEDFRSNPALCFIDFGLLEKDMTNMNKDEAGARYIPGLLTRIKYLHELTKWYRN